MKWVAWRQSRLEFFVGLAVMALLAGLLVPVGLQQMSLFRHLGLATMSSSSASYAALSQQFLNSYPIWLNLALNIIGFLLLTISALLAVPIVLEFEQRTYRLAWTQSITRRRWLLAKLGFGLASVVVLSSLYCVLMTWFLGPQNTLTGAFNYFTQEGIVPVSYAVFSFAIALAVGILSRRSSFGVIIAVIVGVVAITTALPALGHGLPPNYLKPLEEVSTINLPALNQQMPGTSVNIEAKLPLGAWEIDHHFIDASGNIISLTQALAGGAGGTVSQVVEYQPASRYWTFQGIEAFIFIGASIVLFGASLWVIERRLR